MAGVALADSSAIQTSSYEAETKILTVTFANGDRYAYEGVTQEIADLLAKAESKGKAFNELVKDKFPSRKVE
jgi:hypothetical protein